MSTKLLKEINVKFPKTNEKLESSYSNCVKRKKFIEISNKFYSKHLELAKDDLNSISVDFAQKFVSFVEGVCQ